MSYLQYLKSLGVNEDRATLYIQYAETLAETKLPVIFEVKHFSSMLGVKLGFLSDLINNQHKHYNTFNVPKRSGGARSINAPKPHLLYIQKWINKNILARVHVSVHSHAYISGRSIVTHARTHLNQNEIYKLDVSDFFNNITADDILNIFLSLGYDYNISVALSRLCTLNGTLPQGAPTSPALSNLAMVNFDEVFCGIVYQYNCKYSRYSDDLCISGETIPDELIKKTNLLLQENGFHANSKKSKKIIGKKRRVITGISLSSGTLKPEKNFRRRVRQLVHHLKSISAPEAIKYYEDAFIFDRVIGMLSYWNFVDEDNFWVKENIAILKNIIQIQPNVEDILE